MMRLRAARDWPPYDRKQIADCILNLCVEGFLKRKAVIGSQTMWKALWNTRRRSWTN